MNIDRVVTLLLVFWVLTMISLPIARWTWGDPALQQGIVLVVLTQVLVVLVILVRAWGWMRTAGAALVVVTGAWLAEAIGSATGLPFGNYSYTPVLQPQVALVPVLIPLAWLMMLPPAWAIASAITHSRRGLVLISAVALTAWDLYLDPQMVAWGFWTWEQPGAYFGIPLINFGGWLLVSALITAVVRPSALPVLPLAIVYGLTWILQAIGQFFFWGLPGPAFFGFIAMGVMVIWAWVRNRRQILSLVSSSLRLDNKIASWP